MSQPRWQPLDQSLTVRELVGEHLLFLPEGDGPAVLCRVDEPLPASQGHPPDDPPVRYVRLDGDEQFEILTPLAGHSLARVARALCRGPATVVATTPWRSMEVRRPLRPELRTLLAVLASSLLAVVLGVLASAAFPQFLVVALAAAGLTTVLALRSHRRRHRRLTLRTAGALRLDSGNVAEYARARLAGRRPELDHERTLRGTAIARVDAIREEYVALREDVVARIDLPALFDSTVAQTAAFEVALLGFDDLRDQPGTDLSAAAAELEVAWSTALRNAEALGHHHYPTPLRDEARRASKVAHLAERASNDGERVASLTQLRRILDGLGLTYLPRLDERLAIAPPETPHG